VCGGYLGVRKLKGIIWDIKKNVDRMGRICGTYGGENICRVLVEKSEAKRSLVRPESRWEINSDKKNGKAIPLQAWTGLEGSRRLRFPDFMTIGTRKW